MRRILILIAAGATLGAGACRYESAFERTNPFDPEGSARLSLAGPDSTYSVGEEIQVDLISSEPMPPGPLLIGWQSSNPQLLVAAAEGRYVVGVGASALYADILVTARLANRSVSHVVRVGQLADSLLLVCSPTAQCDATALGVGAQRAVTMSMFDARTNPINGVLTALGRRTVTSRNPGVAEPVLPLPLSGTFQVAGTGVGSTWIVVAVDRAIDSVHFTVTP